MSGDGDGDGDGAGEGIGDGSGGQDAGTGDTGEGTGGSGVGSQGDNAEGPNVGEDGAPDTGDDSDSESDADTGGGFMSNTSIDPVDQSTAAHGFPNNPEFDTALNDDIAGFLDTASNFGVMGMVSNALGMSTGPGHDEGSTADAASEGEGSPGVGGAGGSGEGTTLLTQPDPAVVTPLPEVVDTPGEVVPDLDKGTSAASPTVTPNTPTPAPGSLIRRRRRSSTILTTPQGVGQLGGDGSALRGSRRTRSLPVGVPRQTLLGG